MGLRIKLIQKLLVITIFGILLGLSGSAYFNLKKDINEYKKSFEEKVFSQAERLNASKGVSAEISDRKISLLKMRALLFGILTILIACWIVYEFSSIANAFNTMAGSLKKSSLSIETLKYAEQRFYDIAQNRGECIWETNAQGKYTYISPVAEKTLGYMPQEVIGKYFYDFFLPDEKEELKNAELEIFSKKEAFNNFLNRNIRKDSQVVIIATSGVPVIGENGILLGYKGVNRDITEQKNKEEEIKKNYEIQKLTNELLIFTLNETDFKNFLNYTLDLLLSIKWYPFLSKGAIFFIDKDPEVLEMKAKKNLSENLLKKCETVPFGKCICGRAAKNKEIEFVAHINEKHEVIIEGMQPHGHYCVPIILNAKIIGVINLCVKDGAARNQKLENFLSSIANMLAGIYVRNKTQEELKKAYQQLKLTQAQLVQSAKMSSLGMLAGGVAHEINNPLTGVLNNVQLINLVAESKKDFNLADFKELLKIIEDSALRCVNIVKSLLGFSRASQETKKETSLNETIKTIVSLTEQEMRLQNICIEQQLAPDLPLIETDTQLFQQVILDIIANAKWAIMNKPDRNSSIITVKTEYDIVNKCILLYIKDTGIGIPKENLEKIFDPFFTTKPVGEGTGLGLSISYMIIKQLKGDITVESEVNQGTAFKIILPVS